MCKLFTVLFLITIHTFCFAEWDINWQGSGQWGPNSEIVKRFDLKTVNVYHGTAVSIERIIPKPGMVFGIVLKLKTDKEIYNVLLGPAWFIENQDLKIDQNEEIDIIASKITFDKKTLLLPTELTKGNQTLKLRDANGKPIWCAWK